MSENNEQYDEDLEKLKSGMRTSFNILKIIPLIFGLACWIFAGMIAFIAISMQWQQGFNWITTIVGFIGTGFLLFIGNLFLASLFLFRRKRPSAD
ncbi:MAG: hypothetical protein OIF56_14930 [Cohaesibacter sp.]|nr:hypothetical protein [Cohaesibacter sp.]